MANNTVVKITVQELTKYGFKANDRYVNYSKQLTESDKAKVVPGAELEAEYYIADSGKEYLNKVLSSATVVGSGTESPKVDTTRAKKFTPTFNKAAAPDNSMSKADWAAKDRSQLIGGLSHDAAELTAAALTVWGTLQSEAVVLRTYKSFLEGMLKIREELK